MSEDRSVGKEVQRRKRHSFWWVWVLLILIAFGGGVIVGLKLNTMPLPNEMKDRLYPMLESYIPGSTASHDPAAPAPVPAPAQEIAAEAEAVPAPEETAMPAETAAPEAAETAAPESTPAPAETPEVLVMEKAETFNASEGAALADRQAPAEKKYVGVSVALKHALEQAKVDEEDADVGGVLRTKDEDGNPVYKVSFKSGEYSYDYVIDAVSGEVVSWEKSGFSHMESMTYAASFAEEPVTESEAAAIAEAPAAEAAAAPEKTAAPAPVKEKITEERAKEIAFAHAGVKPTEVKRVTARAEFDDGFECYDVDFVTADGRYEYKIEAYTGEILEFEQER
ncbi:MAG: PepSY domain-containing protein [Oscillospiraceae bacterium]|nr:PepSY domain-containing protein [Oscillospiraceae bacterium]